MCLALDLLEFILLGVCWASWMGRLMAFIKFREVLVIISLNILYIPFSLSFPSRTPGMHMLICLMVFWGFVHFPSLFFVFPRLDNLNSPIFKFSDFFLLPAQICYWEFLVKFSFPLLYFQLQNFCLVPFIIFISLLILCIWWDLILRFSFRSLNIFNIAGLKFQKPHFPSHLYCAQNKFYLSVLASFLTLHTTFPGFVSCLSSTSNLLPKAFPIFWIGGGVWNSEIFQVWELSPLPWASGCPAADELPKKISISLRKWKNARNPQTVFPFLPGSQTFHKVSLRRDRWENTTDHKYLITSK